MTDRDISGLIIIYGWAFGILILATVVQKWRGYPAEFTRKIVHVGAGMAMIPNVMLFEHWYFGLIPIGSFIVLNYVSYRLNLIKAMDLSGDTPGTVYFAFACTTLLAIFWSNNLAYIAVAGVMAMTWGDAFAAILGRAFGKHAYFIGSHRRTFEGSAAMFVFSFVPMLLTLSLSNTGLDWYKILGFTFLLALVATLLEAGSLVGLDNITVPFTVSFVLWALVTWNVNLGMIYLGLIISTIIGVFAYRKRSLSLSGVYGAMITGTLIYGFGGWSLGLVLIAFFIYSTVLSHYKERQKAKVAEEKFEKGGRRDLGQALANGGLGGVIAVLYFLNPDKPWILAAYVATMGTVNGDTWATEIGVLSKIPPRMITNGKRVTPGTSGGITPLGTSASLLGALAIGITSYVLLLIFNSIDRNGASGTGLWWVIIAAAIGGLAGTMFDSLLGATVQAMFTNPETGKETEKKIARNGVKNVFKRGLPFMDNDMVNFLSSAFGALIGILVAWPFI